MREKKVTPGRFAMSLIFIITSSISFKVKQNSFAVLYSQANHDSLAHARKKSGLIALLARKKDRKRRNKTRKMIDLTAGWL